jgi:uncharacterized membrane protein
MFSRKRNKSVRLVRFPQQVLIHGLLIALMVFHFSPGLARGASPSSAPAEISFPVSQFADGKAHHFTYPAPGGVTIKYFIIKSSDGVIRAAFDACDVCWPSGKGYQQEGDQMVCRNCGKKFATKLVNEVKGGCNPAPLKRTLKGDKLVIQTKDILDGRNYFNF